MGDKKKNSKKKKSDQSVMDTLNTTVENVGTMIATPVTGAIATIEEVGDNTRKTAGTVAEGVADIIKNTSGEAKHLAVDTTHNASGAVQAVIEKVKPDDRSGKKNKKKDGKKKNKKK